MEERSQILVRCLCIHGAIAWMVRRPLTAVRWKSVVCLTLASIEARANKDERSQVAETIAYELLGQINRL